MLDNSYLTLVRESFQTVDRRMALGGLRAAPIQHCPAENHVVQESQIRQVLHHRVRFYTI